METDLVKVLVVAVTRDLTEEQINQVAIGETIQRACRNIIEAIQKEYGSDAIKFYLNGDPELTAEDRESIGRIRANFDD